MPQPTRVLIVSVRHDRRERASEMLLRCGFATQAATSPSAALAKLSEASERPDVILVDAEHASGDLESMLDALDQRPFAPEIVVVAAAEAAKHLRVRKGVARVIESPWSLDALVTFAEGAPLAS